MAVFPWNLKWNLYEGPRYYAYMPDTPLSENKHLSPEPPKHGSTLGIIIIILLLLAMGAYFAFVRLEQRRKEVQQIPYIPAATTSTNSYNN